ncbi:hypothetical protein AWC17_21625 [Mycobacterium nebraskense]|uniref:Uncharacterized protein n=1 Tax=Mycobacterium nebraskense TaxID=244292 RepID=A0A0F5N7X1_9MYCO|nr:hypothetical protein WU83_20345 [Mycobacterium nebraskense]KLO32482.1 hypothetical protein ABW17_28940 [Mycobacterium nebraskense]ORW35653.1 hypothetical protein AWC17_21625 [Mycobacterium nebraskense]
MVAATAWAIMRAAPLPELVLPARSLAPVITGALVWVLIVVIKRGQPLAQDLFPDDLRVPVARALFGVSVDRTQQRVDIDEARPSAPGNRSTRWQSAPRCSRNADSSWRACPKVTSRNNIPMVEGAYTPSKRVFIPPERTISRSSILSAPAHIPAITVVSFGDGLADPDLIRGSAIRTFLANNCGRPIWGSQRHHRH